MATQLKAARVAFWSLAVASLIVLGTWLVFRQSPVPLPVLASSCQPLPPNIERLAPALDAQDATVALAAYGQAAATLRRELQSGDTIHAYETAVTGGHLVMRGNCYIGRVVSWIR